MSSRENSAPRPIVSQIKSQFLFDKNRNYENKWERVFYLFSYFKNLVFLKNWSINFQKNGTNGNSAHSPVRLGNSLCSLCLTPLFTVFGKVCGGGGGGGGGGGIFDIYFWIFLHFLKNYPLKSETLGLTDRAGFGNLPSINGYAQFFSQKIMALRKVKFSISWLLFETFWLFSKPSQI